MSISYSEDAQEQVITTARTLDEDTNEGSLRPKTLEEYIGQHKVKENLNVFIQAAKMRHDEIHRLNRSYEEILYPAMEDYAIDIILGKGPSANSLHLDLPHFTLIGATTRSGQLTAPLRDRFGVTLRLELYTPEDLQKIVTRSAGIMEVEIDPDGAYEIARRSRGTPRIANRMLRRVRDFAQVKAGGRITQAVANEALLQLEVDNLGFDALDRRMLRAIIEYYGGGPVGLDTLAATINEESVTLEDVYEPYLLQLGFLTRTPRGASQEKPMNILEFRSKDKNNSFFKQIF